MSESLVTGDAPRPKTEPRTLDIDWVRAGGKMRVLWLSKGFHSQVVHWCPLTVPCERTPLCPYCIANKVTQKSAYAHVWNLGSKREIVFQFPETAALDLLNRIAKGEILRGKAFEFVRANSKAHDPVYYKDIGEGDVSGFPEIDVLPSLHKVWGLNRARVLNSIGAVEIPPAKAEYPTMAQVAAQRLAERNRRYSR